MILNAEKQQERWERLEVTSRGKRRMEIADENKKDALLALGAAYYENRKNSDFQCDDLINKINECVEKERLLEQFELCLNDKVMCEKCDTINAANNKHCSNCGEAIKTPDFSALGDEYVIAAKNKNKNACVRCGTPLNGENPRCPICKTKSLPYMERDNAETEQTQEYL